MGALKLSMYSIVISDTTTSVTPNPRFFPTKHTIHVYNGHVLRHQMIPPLLCIYMHLPPSVKIVTQVHNKNVSPDGAV